MSESLIDKLNYALYISDVIVKFVFYASIIICPLGLAFNTFSIFIFNRKTFRDMTMSTYNIIIGIVNNAAVIITFIYFVPSYFKIDSLALSPTSCKLLPYLNPVLLQLSSWIDMLIAVDRGIFISFPHRFFFMRKKRIVLTIIACISIFLMLINVGKFESYIVYSSSNVTVKNVTQSLTTKACFVPPHIVFYGNIVIIVIRIGIPFVIMAIANTITVIKLKHVRQERWSEREVAFTRSVVAINTLFFATQLPYLITLIIQIVLTNNGSDPLSKTNLNFTLAFYVSMAITAYNYSLPCLVNLKFNKLFRDEIFQVFNIKNKNDASSNTSGKNVN